MFKELKEDVDEVKKTMYEQYGNIISKRQKTKTQNKKILQLVSIRTEMENSLKASEGRLQQAEESANLEIRQQKLSEIAESEENKKD